MNLSFDLPQSQNEMSGLDLTKFYIAKITEILVISPNNFSKAGVPDVAVCYTVYDRGLKTFFTTAERIAIHIGPGSKLLDLFSSIIGHAVSPKNFPSGKVDVSKFIGKKIALHFGLSTKARPYIDKRAYLTPEKYKDIDWTTFVYTTPDWVSRQQQAADDDRPILSEDVDANSYLDEMDMPKKEPTLTPETSNLPEVPVDTSLVDEQELLSTLEKEMDIQGL